MLPIKKSTYAQQQKSTRLPIVQTVPLAVLILTFGSVGLDYLRHLNIDYFLTIHYGLIFLMYLYGWTIILLCGRGVTFLCLLVNFVLFAVILGSGQSMFISYDNVLSVLQHLPDYLSPTLLDNTHFWIGGGIVAFQMIWLAPRSFFNPINAASLICFLVLIYVALRIIGYPTKSVFYPLWPGVYDAFYVAPPESATPKTRSL